MGETRRSRTTSTGRLVLPAQAGGAHDALAPDRVPEGLTGPPTGVPESAEWRGRRGSRLLSWALALAVFEGLVFFGVYGVLQRSMAAMAAAGGCLVLLVLGRMMSMSAGGTAVQLRGSRLTVHRDGFVDTFDLATTYNIIELVGTPRSRSWRILLEATDGRVVELGRQHVDAEALDAAVRYYRRFSQGHRPHQDGEDLGWRG